jgi:hypothetical protein
MPMEVANAASERKIYKASIFNPDFALAPENDQSTASNQRIARSAIHHD